jgi:hypothetical protein
MQTEQGKLDEFEESVKRSRSSRRTAPANGEGLRRAVHNSAL